MNYKNIDIYMLRHGQTEWNTVKRVQGRMNSKLTQQGKAQARQQRDILCNLNDASARTIFCSPSGRATETANIALENLNTPPIYDERLLEINVGDWEGLLQSELMIKNPEHFVTEPSFLSLYTQAPNGEGLEQLTNRCHDFLSSLQGPSILISHGVTITVLRGILLNLNFTEMEKWGQTQGCVVHIKDANEKTYFSNETSKP